MIASIGSGKSKIEATTEVRDEADTIGDGDGFYPATLAIMYTCTLNDASMANIAYIGSDTSLVLRNDS